MTTTAGNSDVQGVRVVMIDGRPAIGPALRSPVTESAPIATIDRPADAAAGADAPAGSPAPALELRGLGRHLPSGGRSLTILEDVDLRIERGESVAVVGPSGSGKSTLLGLMAGLDRPSTGTAHLLGRNLADLDEDGLARLRREHVGFVFQSFHLLGNLTARENVSLPLELLGRPDAMTRAGELLAAVGLAERGHHRPVQLSGGEQQRVALARAFAADPAVLFADEPTGNLDAGTGGRIIEMLEELHAAHGTTLILVTHDERLAARCGRIIRLEAGRIVADETTATTTDAAPAPTPDIAS
jgi:putative ABC transport system ATP-binding protein